MSRVEIRRAQNRIVQNKMFMKLIPFVGIPLVVALYVIFYLMGNLWVGTGITLGIGVVFVGLAIWLEKRDKKLRNDKAELLLKALK